MAADPLELASGLLPAMLDWANAPLASNAAAATAGTIILYMQNSSRSCHFVAVLRNLIDGNRGRNPITLDPPRYRYGRSDPTSQRHIARAEQKLVTSIGQQSVEPWVFAAMSLSA
jgi:hypothetical protein